MIPIQKCDIDIILNFMNTIFTWLLVKTECQLKKYKDD